MRGYSGDQLIFRGCRERGPSDTAPGTLTHGAGATVLPVSPQETGGAWLPGPPIWTGVLRKGERAVFSLPGTSLTGSPGKEAPSECSLGSRVELSTSSPLVAGGPAV